MPFAIGAGTDNHRKLSLLMRNRNVLLDGAEPHQILEIDRTSARTFSASSPRSWAFHLRRFG